MAMTDVMRANELDVDGEARLYRALRRFWHPVAYSSEVTDGPVRTVLLDEQLVVVRLGGAVRCFADLCAHRGTAISLGWVEDDQIRCAYHGWTYGPDGVCTAIPARFGSNIPRRARLQPHLVTERYGLIWVCLEDEPLYPIPECPAYDDPGQRVIAVPSYEWRCSAARRIENYVDFAHFAWVHDGVLGDREHPEVPEHDVIREQHWLRFGEEDLYRPHDSPDETEATARSRERGGLPYASGTLLADKAYRLYMPFTVLLDQRLPGDRHYLLYFSASPTGPKSTRCFTLMIRNYDMDPGSDHKFEEFNELVIGQDRPIVESQRPEELPVDLSDELHIRGVDRVSLEYRKWLTEFARSEAQREESGV
jgi:phenylpropionate dioxygenase-like ring-hydroxylating dioxygenase large terminal subunit